MDFAWPISPAKIFSWSPVTVHREGVRLGGWLRVCGLKSWRQGILQQKLTANAKLVSATRNSRHGGLKCTEPRHKLGSWDA